MSMSHTRTSPRSFSRNNAGPWLPKGDPRKPQLNGSQSFPSSILRPPLTHSDLKGGGGISYSYSRNDKRKKGDKIKKGEKGFSLSPRGSVISTKGSDIDSSSLGSVFGLDRGLRRLERDGARGKVSATKQKRTRGRKREKGGKRESRNGGASDGLDHARILLCD